MTEDSTVGAARGFTYLPHTADKAVEVWGQTLRDLFIASAEAMFSVSEDLDSIGREREWTFEVEAGSPEDLLHAWLSELLWISERDEAIPCEFELDELEEHDWRLRARARGGPVPPEEPHTGAPVKAVTYHDLHIWREGERWKAHLVFDV